MLSPSATYLSEHNRDNRRPIYQVVFTERRGTRVITEPTAYWKLDEVDGSRVDEKALAHLDMSGTVASITGKIRKAAVCSPGLNGYLSTADQTAIRTGPQDWSFCCWVKLSDKPTVAGIASKDTGTATQREWQLVYDQVSDRFKFSIYYASGASTVSVSANTFGGPSLDTWYFIVIRHTASSKTLSISVNNGTEDTNTYVGTANAGSAPMYIGNTYAAVSQVFDGAIDEAGLWIGYVLTANEVTSLYNSGDGRSIRDFSIDREAASVCTAHPITGEDIGTEILIPQVLTRKVEIEKCRFPLTTFNFLLQDISSQATALISSGFVGLRCDLYAGFYDIPWAGNYVQLFGGIVTEFEYDGGSYRVLARSQLTAAHDKMVFAGASSRLVNGIGSTETSITLADASAFDVAHDLPQSARRAALCDQEIFVYRAKSGNVLSNIQRPGAVGFSVPPNAGPAAGHSAGAFVRELPKLGNVDNLNDQLGAFQTEDLHPIDLEITMFEEEGKFGFGEANLEYNDTEFEITKNALGRRHQMRFVHDAPSNAKRFIEEEFYLPHAGYPTEDEHGRLGFKLYDKPANVVARLTDANLLTWPHWVRNAEKLINIVAVNYDYMPTTKEYTSMYIYRDETLIDQLGYESVLEINSKGYRSKHNNVALTQQWFTETANVLRARAQAHIERFGGVMPVIEVETPMNQNLLQTGDEVYCTFSQAIHMGSGKRQITDARFEVAGMRIDFQKNTIQMELLGFNDAVPASMTGHDIGGDSRSDSGFYQDSRRRRLEDDWERPRTLY